MKKLSLILTTAVASLALGVLAGCGGSDNSDKIKIACVKLGYGTEWLSALTKEYTKQTGVEFYYQEVVGSAGNGNLNTQLESLSGTFDLYGLRPDVFYKMLYSGSVKAKGQVYETAFEPLTDIYQEPYAGETGNNTMEKKMDPQFKNYVNLEDNYYAVPWSNGFLTFVRNLDVWESFGFTKEQYPRTTDELFEMMDEMRKISTDTTYSKYNKDLKETYPMIYCASDEYYTSIFGSWFAQYEGPTEMQKFYGGRNPDGKRGTDMYTFDGVLESLKVMDRIVEFDNESGLYTYQHQKSKSLSFTQMQNYFLLGAAAFCVNGTWLDIESPSAREKNLDFIKIPLVSSIVNNDSRLSKKYTETELREIVSFIDAHPTVGDNNGAPGNVVAEDLEVFRESRNTGSYMRVDYDHLFVIPAWATKKPEAKAFLKWMYSDEGLNVYNKTMQGHHLPAFPSTGSYDNTGITQSPFRQAANKVLDEGHFCPYLVNTVKDKIFSVAGVQSNASNTISRTGNCLKWMVDGFTPDQVVVENTAYLVAKWSSILNSLDKE